MAEGMSGFYTGVTSPLLGQVIFRGDELDKFENLNSSRIVFLNNP
jgi:hypothetical protein